MASFSNRLRMLIETCGLSVPRLAEFAGVSNPTVYAILQGHEPRPATREAIERALRQIADTITAEDLPATAHPGIAALLADTAACRALGLADPGELRLSVGGVPVVLTSRDAALLQLMALRANGE